MLDVLESFGIENSHCYFDLENVSFDHPFTLEEIENFKAIVFSKNALKQVYFKKNADLNSIETVKNLLSISSYIDDDKVEKCVALNLSFLEFGRLMESSFEHPSTWQIAYDHDEHGYYLADLPSCRNLYFYLEQIHQELSIENYSPLEKMLKIYDIVKMYEYRESLEEESIPEMIREKVGTAYGLNRLFSYLLSHFGFRSLVLSGRDAQRGEICFTASYVHDEQYGYDGIYLFDPSMDSLSKEDYPKEEIRKINYNFFALPCSSLSYSKEEWRLVGPMGILAMDDFDYGVEKWQDASNEVFVSKKKTIENKFHASFEQLYSYCHPKKEISFPDISSLRHKVYGKEENSPEFENLARENYEIRKEEWFYPKSEEILKQMISSL